MNRIKEVLKEQGRTQAWLASKLDISRSTMALYCNNQSQPKIITLYKVAEFLDVDAKDLLVSTKEKETKKWS